MTTDKNIFVRSATSIEQIKDPSIDTYCKTWQTVQEWVKLEKQRLMDRLCSPTRTHDESMLIRGKIIALECVMDLPVRIAEIRQ